MIGSKSFRLPVSTPRTTATTTSGTTSEKGETDGYQSVEDVKDMTRKNTAMSVHCIKAVFQRTTKISYRRRNSMEANEIYDKVVSILKKAYEPLEQLYRRGQVHC